MERARRSVTPPSQCAQFIPIAEDGADQIADRVRARAAAMP